MPKSLTTLWCLEQGFSLSPHWYSLLMILILINLPPPTTFGTDLGSFSLYHQTHINMPNLLIRHNISMHSKDSSHEMAQGYEENCGRVHQASGLKWYDLKCSKMNGHCITWIDLSFPSSFLLWHLTVKSENYGHVATWGRAQFCLPFTPRQWRQWGCTDITQGRTWLWFYDAIFLMGHNNGGKMGM